jgi:hypothetical protein
MSLVDVEPAGGQTDGTQTCAPRAVKTGVPTSSRRDSWLGLDARPRRSSIPGEEGIDIFLEDGDFDGVVSSVSREDSAGRVEPPPALGKGHSPVPADPQVR